MVNTENLLSVLKLDYYGLNASAFADKIGVQRSSLSHLLSGRNKPSLDFILKIVDVFPDVDLYWILNGREFS
jgi:plasmid maintenance system antidote protein VapI